MKRNLNKLFVLLFPAILAIISAGCINDMDKDSELGKENDGKALLILKVRSGEDFPSLSENEKMHSLRVILLDDKGQPEQNEFYRFETSKVEEEISLMTIAGKKKVFLIANEMGVDSYYSELIDTGGKDFSEFLASVSSFGENCEDILNSLVIYPNFKDNIIPQTSCYEAELKTGDTQELTMHVVKAGIKVTFTFLNSRNEEVQLNQVRLSSFADRMYLMGHVGEKDYKKDGLYWVDWLCNVSKESQTHPDYDDNLDFNGKKGWITDYQLPEDTQHSMISFIETEEDPWKVDPQKTIENKDPELGELLKGPYYFSESSNILTSGTTQQQYYLSLNIQDKENNFTISRQLPNAKALFRNSHLDIEVNMAKGATDIYVEIKAWTQSEEVYGTVDEED